VRENAASVRSTMNLSGDCKRVFRTDWRDLAEEMTDRAFTTSAECLGVVLARVGCFLHLFVNVQSNL
jgi:hypothetical protein